MRDAPVQGCPLLPLDVFRDAGYLLETNRKVLHPLGLALGIVGDRLVVFDSRDDPDGVRFGGDWSDVRLGKVANVERIAAERRPRREAALGYWVEPPGPWWNHVVAASPEELGEVIFGDLQTGRPSLWVRLVRVMPFVVSAVVTGYLLGVAAR